MNGQDEKEEMQEGKFFAVISYISFLCIIALVLRKDNKFALYHAKQGLVLFVFEVAGFVLSIIPVLGWAIKTFGTAIAILISLWGILQALMGNYGRIFLVSDIADKISL
ncbi:MAG: hypothetical protein FJZ13_02600 [Candidatus Omnitrophica bacterium]|nr:hypothetical protein [Candidatus Omnitrophota bacterium]